MFSIGGKRDSPLGLEREWRNLLNDGVCGAAVGAKTGHCAIVQNQFALNMQQQLWHNTAHGFAKQTNGTMISDLLTMYTRYVLLSC